MALGTARRASLLGPPSRSAGRQALGSAALTSVQPIALRAVRGVMRIAVSQLDASKRDLNDSASWIIENFFDKVKAVFHGDAGSSRGVGTDQEWEGCCFRHALGTSPALSCVRRRAGRAS